MSKVTDVLAGLEHTSQWQEELYKFAALAYLAQS